MTSNRPTPAYPTALQVEISHSTRFARALRTLEVPIAPDLAVTARDEEEAAEDGASLWLEGRAEEVAVFTADVLRAWSSGELELNAAVRVIREYVQALQAALEEWYAGTASREQATRDATLGVSALLQAFAERRVAKRAAGGYAAAATRK